MKNNSPFSAFIDCYLKLRNSIKKNDYDSFVSLVDSKGVNVPKNEWNSETASFILETMPDPKDLEFLDLASKGTDFRLYFLQTVSDSEGLYLYGAIFFKKEKEKILFSRLLIRNFESKKNSAKTDALDAIASDSDLSFTSRKQKPKKEESKSPNSLSLRNEYENGWTPYVIVTPPTGWFDMNSSGNSSYGGFETLTMGGIGFSQSGEADYSTKRKMEFGFCKSNKSIVDFSEALKTSGFTITKISDSSFSAFKKDKFWGNIFQLIRTEPKGFLVGSVSSESNSDFEFSKKVLMEIFPKIKIKF
jgi:hypothetical protein